MKTLLLALSLILPLIANADGTDKPDPLAKPESFADIEVWLPFAGVGHLKQLYPEHLGVLPYHWRPNPVEPVKPTGPNYWIYYDKHPCRGDYASVTPERCRHDDDDYNHDPDPKPIPETPLGVMLGIGLSALAVLRRRRLK